MSTHGSPKANGFSLVEVVIAVVILSVGLLSLASVSGYVTTQVRLAEERTERMLATQTAAERIRATPYTQITSGSDKIGRYDVSWTAARQSFALTHITIVTVGRGYSPSAGWTETNADTFRISVTR